MDPRGDRDTGEHPDALVEHRSERTLHLDEGFVPPASDVLQSCERHLPLDSWDGDLLALEMAVIEVDVLDRLIELRYMDAHTSNNETRFAAIFRSGPSTGYTILLGLTRTTLGLAHVMEAMDGRLAEVITGYTQDGEQRFAGLWQEEHI